MYPKKVAGDNRGKSRINEKCVEKKNLIKLKNQSGKKKVLNISGMKRGLSPQVIQIFLKL